MKKYDGLLMFSGGLDSTVAAHLLTCQNLSILAVHYVLPFYSGIEDAYPLIRRHAEQLGIPLRIEEEGEEFLAMVRSPRFGFGKNANPCVDCRMHRLKKTTRIMEEVGASFIATGEVIGQRPM
jgi:tRNA-uridine 2-sulfurtransferase